MADMMTKLDPRSRAAARGLSDITIRNLFVIPTVAFLIIFNIFPLLYSLGFSFTDFRASTKEPANFVGFKNYRDLLPIRIDLAQLHITAEYVIVSVTGQFVVGFGLALLLNRSFPVQGTGHRRCCCLPMMLSMVVVGLFWKLLYDPNFGILNYVLGLGKFEWLSRPEHRPLRRGPDRHLDVVAFRDAAVAGRPLGRAEAPLRGGVDRPRQPDSTPSSASRCRWWRRSC